MSDYKGIAGSFLCYVKDHEMIIIKNDGIDRHIRFGKPGSITYQFDLITWKLHLCITGDIGTYVFSRIEDMFNFFDHERNTTNNLVINPGYWSEKILSESVFGGGIKTFSVDKFHGKVEEYFDIVTEYLEVDDKKELWKEVKDQINGDDEWECVEQMRNFSHDKINFHDFWDYSCEEYTHNYILCCYAIVWGIKKYMKERS